MNQACLSNLIQPVSNIGEDGNLLLEAQIIVRNVLAESPVTGRCGSWLTISTPSA